VVLYVGLLAPHLAASIVVDHWGGNKDSPLALSLRLLASTEHCSTGPASPACSLREPSDLSGLDPGDLLGLMQDVLEAHSRILLIPDYSRDTIIAIMELIGHLHRCIKSKLVLLP
jgi:hypothetical protein